MRFASWLAWAAIEIQTWRTMRSLEGLSDHALHDIALPRGMIEGAARRKTWGFDG
jgi:uncharacterized protein YjiS (DUF1127 family)